MLTNKMFVSTSPTRDICSHPLWSLELYLKCKNQVHILEIEGNAIPFHVRIWNKQKGSRGDRSAPPLVIWLLEGIVQLGPNLSWGFGPKMNTKLTIETAKTTTTTSVAKWVVFIRSWSCIGPFDQIGRFLVVFLT